MGYTRMSPMDILYAHDSIAHQFKNGNRLEDVFRLLADDISYINEIPAIPVMFHNGKYWAADGNRRLFLYRTLYEFGALTEISVRIVSFDFTKYQQAHTTENGGTSVRVRSENTTHFLSTLRNIWNDSQNAIRRQARSNNVPDYSGSVNRHYMYNRPQSGQSSRSNNNEPYKQAWDAPTPVPKQVHVVQPIVPEPRQASIRRPGQTRTEVSAPKPKQPVISSGYKYSADTPTVKRQAPAPPSRAGPTPSRSSSVVLDPGAIGAAEEARTHRRNSADLDLSIYGHEERRPWYRRLLCC